MGIKVKGINETITKINRIIDDVKGVRIIRALYIISEQVLESASVITPIDTSMLVNSRYIDFDTSGGRITAKVGFSAAYAAYVHDAPGKLKGQPRAHFGTTRAGKQFGGGTEQGIYWGPGGEPQFLKKGLQQVRPHIPELMAKGMKK
nr:MAG TPA_asm: Minor capsid protein [Caudoviricetes sp.]